jgi:prolyl-tRNA editing enzyme YbaK/EbsC (Cys-tRNA(Pro) deacylase)
MSTRTHRNVEQVVAALAAGGADPTRVARMLVLPDAVTTAAAAAEALGVEVGQIANSLVFEADGSPLLVLTSGAHRVDTAKVAALIGAERVRRATPEFVRAATGQAIGGVGPVGHPAPLRTLVDRHLQRYDEVWAAGGIPHAVFPTTYAELVAVTGGEPADVA